MAKPSVNSAHLRSPQRRRRDRCATSCVAVLAWRWRPARGASDASTLATQSTDDPASRPPVSATLEQCTTSTAQAERSATFAGEMTAIPGTAKMEMRIEVLERLPRETDYHLVVAPGLGGWRTAGPRA